MSKNNLSISSLLSSDTASTKNDVQSESTQSESAYYSINHGVAKPFVNNAEGKSISTALSVDRDGEDQTRSLRSQGSQKTIDGSSTSASPQASQLQSPAGLRSTKVSLMSMMNSDTPAVSTIPTIVTTAPAPTSPSKKPKTSTVQIAKPSRKMAAGSHAHGKPVKVMKKRKVKKATPSHPEINTTIIIDGKPVVIPAVPSATKTEALKRKLKAAAAGKSRSKSSKAEPGQLSRQKPGLASSLMKKSVPKSSSSESTTKPLVTLNPPNLADVRPAMELDMGNSTTGSNPLDPLLAKKPAEVPEEPIVSLHIPLVTKDHPPGTAQVIFNVVKLCEDKYGFKAVHPNANFAMDELNDDDDMDDMEDDDDEAGPGGATSEAPVADATSGATSARRDDDKPKKKELSFEAKMNRKIGKYDYEDPFIDDAELLYEEQYVSTKDGFFVYYGPLFEEGQNPRIEKKQDGSRNRPMGGNGSSNTTASRSGPSLTVNGKPIGNPHRGVNGRFSSGRENSVNDAERMPLASILPASRTGTPPIQ